MPNRVDTVPAGQVRAFNSYALRFDNLPPVNGRSHFELQGH